MNGKIISDDWVDSDDAPPLDAAWFDGADVYEGGRLISPGRPPAATRKEAVSLRLDPDLLAWFRGTGPGWQRRINDALRKAANL